MTISLVVGLPGSGKSYTAVERLVLPALKAGRRVVTNLPLRMEAVDEIVPGASALVDNVPNDAWVTGEAVDRIVPGALVLVDEAWRVWPATGKPLHPRWGTVIAEHRHMIDDTGRPVELVLITQSPGQISTGVRRLVERAYYAKKLGALGARGSFSLTIRDGIDGPEVGSSVKKYRPEVFALYQSHTRAGEGVAVGSIDETPTDNASIWTSWQARALALALVVVLPLSTYSCTNFFDPKSHGASAAPAHVAAPSQRGVRQAPAPAAASAPVLRVVPEGVAAVLAGDANPAGSGASAPDWCKGVRVGVRVSGSLQLAGRDVMFLSGPSGTGYVDRDRCRGEWPVVCCHLDGGRYAESDAGSALSAPL